MIKFDSKRYIPFKNLKHIALLEPSINFKLLQVANMTGFVPNVEIKSLILSLLLFL
jgi:hypothetical protein